MTTTEETWEAREKPVSRRPKEERLSKRGLLRESTALEMSEEDEGQEAATACGN